MQPLIDVVIPTYNRKNALALVMDSYLKQDHLGTLIFVDDQSTDGTDEYCDNLAIQYPGKIIYYRMPEKTSLPDMRNVGVSLATHDYVFMGEDDVLLPDDHFAVLLRKMQELGADAISGRRIYMWADQTMETARQVADSIHEPVFVTVPFESYFEHPVDQAQSVNRLHSNALFKKSIFEKVQYDPWYRGNAFREETDFYLRVWDAGFKLWLIPDTLSYHLRSTPMNSSGGSRKKWWVYEWQVWKNTTHLFLKNRSIFTEKLQVGNIYWYLIRCLCARYTYALKRRISQRYARTKQS